MENVEQIYQNIVKSNFKSDSNLPSNEDFPQGHPNFFSSNHLKLESHFNTSEAKKLKNINKNRETWKDNILGKDGVQLMEDR